MAGSGTGTQIPPVSVPSVSIDAWFDEVVPSAQLCPNPVIRSKILDTCRHFCRETELWEVEHLAIDVVAGEPLYPLSISGVDIVGGERAEYDGKPLDAVSAQALDADEREREYWRTKTTEIPTRYYVDEQYRLRLVYIPNNSLVGGLKVVCSVKPLELATTVPAFLYNQYADAITLGTQARLKLIPDMPWTDIRLGASFADMYDGKVFEGKQKKFTGFMHTKTRNIVRTHYHDF